MKYQPPFQYPVPSSLPAGIHNSNPDAPYANGDPVTGVEGSIPPAEAFEHTQREILKVITEASITPSHADLTQLWQALQALFLRGTLANVGAGAQSYKGVTGAFVHQMRTIVAGSNITIEQQADTIVISAAGGGGGGGGAVLENIGTGEAGVYSGVAGGSGNHQLRKIKAGSGITVAVSSNDIVITASGGAGSTVASVGAGAAVFKERVSSEDKLRSLTGTSGIAVSVPGGDSNVINIDGQGAIDAATRTVSNVGSGVGVYKEIVNKDFRLRSIAGINGIAAAISGDGNTINVDGAALQNQIGMGGRLVWLNGNPAATQFDVIIGRQGTLRAGYRLGIATYRPLLSATDLTAVDLLVSIDGGATFRDFNGAVIYNQSAWLGQRSIQATLHFGRVGALEGGAVEARFAVTGANNWHLSGSSGPLYATYNTATNIILRATTPNAANIQIDAVWLEPVVTTFEDA